MQGDSLVIAGADGRDLECWQRRRVEGADERAADGTATLRCTGRPGRLVTRDEALLRAMRRPRRDLGWAVLAVTVLALGGGLVFAGPPVLAAAAPIIPSAWQDRLGDMAVQEAFARAPLCHGAAGQAALDRLGRRLAIAAGIEARVRIEMRDDGVINAFALPASRIVVMRGLLTRLQDGAEFAGVLGHEMAHVQAHDPITGFLRRGVLSAISELTGLGGAVPAATLLTLSYGRAAEARADAAALRMLRTAGLRSDGLARALRLLAGRHEPAGLTWLADHPATAERIRASQGSAEGEPPLSVDEWNAIRAMCAR